MCAFQIVRGGVSYSRLRTTTSDERLVHSPRQRASATLARVLADFVLGAKHDPQCPIADVVKVVAVHLVSEWFDVGCRTVKTVRLEGVLFGSLCQSSGYDYWESVDM